MKKTFIKKEIRPKTVIRHDRADKVAEAASLVFLLITFIIVSANYGNLPDLIPLHFNFKGDVDSEGGKNNIFILPVISAVMYLFITFIQRFPHTFNYPVKITEENASFQYHIALKLLRYLKLLIILEFGLITAAIASGKYNSYLNPVYTMILFLICMATLIIRYLMRASGGTPIKRRDESKV